MSEPITLNHLILIFGALVTAGTILWRLQALFRRLSDDFAAAIDQHRKDSETGRRRLYDRVEKMDKGWEARFEAFRQHCDETYVHAGIHQVEMNAMKEAIHELNVNMTQINGRVCPIQHEFHPPPQKRP